MNRYKYENGIIVDLLENKVLDAKQIYQIIDTDLKKDILEIKFSKMSLNVVLSFNLIDNNIKIEFNAIKFNKTFPIPSYNDGYLDYIVIDNIWHYLGGKYDIIIECLKKRNILNKKIIDFSEYMMLLKTLDEEHVNYIDNVIKNVKDLTIESNTQIIGLKANLFEYQKIGFNWLSFMKKNNCGCILADEMGLGKTLQIICLMGSEYEKNRDIHFLIVAPISLLENWKREIAKFYPNLSTIIHYGVGRTGLYYELMRYNVVITAYTNVKSDLSMLNMIEWDAVILDEAQNIKTPLAERTKVVKMLKKKMGIAVTGTPFENHMTDIWSIVDFVFPNYLGNYSEFTKKFLDNYESASELEKLITPIMIRRLVKNVAKDLPERIDIPQPVEMTYQEALLYEGERKQNIKDSLKNISLDKIQLLRMFCTHPIVYNKDLDKVDPVLISQKYLRLCEILEEIIFNKDKVIIFTSFNKMIEIMVNDLKKRFNIPTLFINGSVKMDDRQIILDEFSKISGSAILICNPKVAGAGLNITCANHVIHYNLEWNPSVEDQASARAYRRGQEKTVFVYRLYYINTIEEVMNDRIQNKRILSDTAVIGNKGTEQDKKDLIIALSLSPYKEEEI